MFNALKKKFNSTVGKLTDKVSREAESEGLKNEDKPSEQSATLSRENKIEKISSVEDDLKEVEAEEKSKLPPSEKEKEVKSESKSFFSRFKSKESIQKDEKEVESVKPTTQDKSIEEEELDGDKSSIFSFIREKTLSEKDVEDILWELEMSLLESDVALEVAETIISSVKNDLVGKKIKRSSDVEDYTRQALKNAISTILDVESINIEHLINKKKAQGEPLIIMFVGINGTGKTTTIAKVSTYFIKKGYTPVIAASDTFRAGAIEQITHHAETIGIKIIKHKKGADPAAVAFDAVSHAKAQKKDLVLIDTAGRMQTNINLMDEMAKIKRVSRPDLIIFVGDSLTGNDAVAQAMKFNDTVNLDGIILTKAEADAKGGAALSIGYVIQKPILFLGTGQSYDDLIEFRPDWMVDQLI
ncbi:signal recognition particle-docking protein FtsY [Methanobacterium alkalithermotolerans]|uniref:Signal recognition particle receptor FtsY n=1 Tax=Methanobacterium alkalithermotolerans TaxID=2731220 RepID=A0A8T8K7T1_9EURY|nr:signal recognition particle-docking protein FtsY [Methanobacterium alkalithermotolerans]QUH23605.1 signal recognition particle-docking protein FtsY [Methanobacterium alkalithermotolerans]